MKEYFGLQLKRANRWLQDSGFNPLLALGLSLAVFGLLSIYLFYKTPYAVYVYLLISLFFTATLSEEKRNEWLEYCFRKADYKKLRIVENSLAALPFLLFLIVRSYFWFALLLEILSVLLVLLRLKTTVHFTLPTPFYKRPFEFTVGFRNTFFLFPVAYLLTAISIMAGNFNLGIFSLLLSFLVVLTYFTKVESENYVWVYNLSAGGFLWKKLRMALLFATLLALPIILSLGIYFYSDMLYLLLFLLLGYVYLIGMVLGKYASFPERLSLPKSILLGICIVFPQGLLILVPIFYKQSVSRLNRLLQR